jgi:Ser/Thr protein kinase RdoA (MazF antagonist)
VNLEPWGPLTVVGPLGGGRRNSVVEVRAGAERLVARRTRRSGPALDWELDLLDFLAGNGFVVPAVVPTVDGRRHADGVVVQRRLAGRPPVAADWPAVATELRRLHTLTAGWPQRPGFRSTVELLTADRGGDVDLSGMPPAAVAACRQAWAALSPAGPAAAPVPAVTDGDPCAVASAESSATSPVSAVVVHGDPCAANVRVGDAGIGLLDWDEARVDHPDLDLAELPGVPLPGARGRMARAAIAAWEAAAGWRLEPEYARRRLAELHHALASGPRSPA